MHVGGPTAYMFKCGYSDNGIYHTLTAITLVILGMLTVRSFDHNIILHI
jgi:hypothetical protein